MSGRKREKVEEGPLKRGSCTEVVLVMIVVGRQVLAQKREGTIETFFHTYWEVAPGAKRVPIVQ